MKKITHFIFGILITSLVWYMAITADYCSLTIIESQDKLIQYYEKRDYEQKLLIREKMLFYIDCEKCKQIIKNYDILKIVEINEKILNLDKNEE